MKKLFMVFVLVTMFAGILLLAGCSQSDSDLVGTWTWDEEASFVTTFNADGTGSHARTWGYGTTFTWTTSGKNIYWEYPNHPRMYTGFSITDDVLIIIMDDGTRFRYIRN
ncbi:MAG: fimbrillin family protein [Defluviitaleaceae bacterium]|nr:fimbrillin family protein [Defluviitaleaceae bacterium]MCL2239286.1 fimbrillin family protein [Defluviitaleaceae bacterium]